MKKFKIALRLLAALFALVVVLIVALMLTFTGEKLALPAFDVGELPAATPPSGMSIAVLPTGYMESRGAFAYRGGIMNEKRNFAMTAVLIRHPKGDLLVDTGFGRNIDEHVKMMPRLMQYFTVYGKGESVGDQLMSRGVTTERLSVLLTHAHWDHVSGLDSVRGVPVLVNPAEQAFIAQRTHNTDLINSFTDVNYQRYDFDGSPYLGFPTSHDIWGDGSVVVVPAPGHTPGSVIVFVVLPSGLRFAMLGDLVWQTEALEIPAERPWPIRRLLGEDDEEVRENIARIVSIQKKFPKMIMVPAHDERAFRFLKDLAGAK